MSVHSPGDRDEEDVPIGALVFSAHSLVGLSAMIFDAGNNHTLRRDARRLSDSSAISISIGLCWFHGVLWHFMIILTH